MDNDLGNQILTEMRAGFNRVDNRIDDLTTEMHVSFNHQDNRIDDLTTEMHTGFIRLDNRIDSLRDLLRSDMSGVNTRFGILESEMRHGFAAQKKATDDVIKHFGKYCGYITEDYVSRTDALSQEIFTVENFLSDEFPEKFKAYLKSR